jgi:hypothetical protein
MAQIADVSTVNAILDGLGPFATASVEISSRVSGRVTRHAPRRGRTPQRFRKRARTRDQLIWYELYLRLDACRRLRSWPLNHPRVNATSKGDAAKPSIKSDRICGQKHSLGCAVASATQQKTKISDDHHRLRARSGLQLRF